MMMDVLNFFTEGRHFAGLIALIIITGMSFSTSWKP
jgi:hypothetical protein